LGENIISDIKQRYYYQKNINNGCRTVTAGFGNWNLELEVFCFHSFIFLLIL
jgi:hypothetical protein